MIRRNSLSFGRSTTSSLFSQLFKILFRQIANLGENELLDGVPGFDEAIRSFMVEIFSITYQKLEVCFLKLNFVVRDNVVFEQCDVFMELLALDDAHLEPYVSQKADIMHIDEKFIVFTPNAQNQMRPKKFKETISFERMLPVLNRLSSP